MVLHAFGSRIAVMNPPAERLTESGLIVISAEINVTTGVVIDNPVHASQQEQTDHPFGAPMELGIHLISPAGAEQLAPGVLVYYVKDSGVRIGDLIIIDMQAILAWEE